MTAQTTSAPPSDNAAGSGSDQRLVRSCWIHTCTNAYRRTLRVCPACGGEDYDACGQTRREYQCLNPTCGAVHKIANLRPNSQLTDPSSDAV